jgi:hypothetical protein
MIGLAAWLLISIWSLARTAYTDYLLAVVSGLVFFALLIPITLWWTRRRHQPAHSEEEESFRRWTSHDFDMWQGRTSGLDAAVEILLPLAAVAFGMTALAIVAHFAA